MSMPLDVHTPVMQTAMSPSSSSTDDDEQSLSVSAVFHPHANLLSIAPDVVLVSSDHVFFYVHSTVLREQSSNNFGGRLPVAPPADGGHTVLPMREAAAVLNVMLLTLYGLPSGQFQPANDVLDGALAGLAGCGTPLAALVAPGTPLFALLAARSPGAPLLVYTLAAEHDLRALAAHASAFLLATGPGEIPAEAAERIGPMYLHRLLALQLRRVEALKEILRAPPRTHPATPCCDEAAQAALARAWMLTAAYFVWERRPEMTTTSMEVAFEKLGTRINCEACKVVFNERVAQVLQGWEQLQRTI